MEFARKFDDVALRALRNTESASLSIAATYDGKVAFAKAFGGANVANAYSIASVSKQFTAASVLILARDGGISLHDPVAKWFPEITASERITVRHLLSHTSGLPDYYPLGFADEEKKHDALPLDIVRKYGTQELQFEPGTSWSYSNTGYHIAGLIVERIAGVPFGTFVQERVLKPSGMNESFFNDPPLHRPEQLSGHTRFCLGPLRDTGPERAGWMYASGGIASTARDLAHWHTVLMNDTLLTAGEREIMMQPAPLKNAGPSIPALGWFVERRGDHTIVQHSGGLAGFAAQTIVSIPKRCSVVILANGDHVQTGAIASELFELLLPGASAPTPQAPSDPARAELAARKWTERLRSRERLTEDELTPEFYEYLDEQRRADALAGLQGAGELQKLTPLAEGERGGMAWFRVRAHFANAAADVILRQTADGRLAEFMTYPVP